MRFAHAVAALVCLSAAVSLGQEAAPTPAPTAPEIPQTQKATPDAEPASQEPRSQEPAAQNPNPPAAKNGADAKPEGTTAGSAPPARAKPPAKPRPKRSPPHASASDLAPKKVVVRRGGASEPSAQIVTGMTPQEALARQQEAEKALDAADESLKRVLGRPLDAQQEETVSQIHNYIGHARSALKEGDISRGYTLAVKANLLAEDLVKY
ncbi:MAG: hypothetical protein WBS24_07345 [Terriglobales bacterium]